MLYFHCPGMLPDPQLPATVAFHGSQAQPHTPASKSNQDARNQLQPPPQTQ